jgi:hypothetical protein
MLFIDALLSDATGNFIRTSLGFSEKFGHPVQVRDAAGNALPRLPDESGYRLAVMATLWPGEEAWRLKLDLKRARGFAPGDIVTFKNVPVPKVGTANVMPITNFVGGMELVLREFRRNPDRSWIRVELPAQPDGVVVDFVEITTDTGEKPAYPGQAAGWPFGSILDLPSIPANVQTMDITWVVQKTRSVEFLVKPPQPN